MNQKELKDLIEFIIEKDIAEFELERGDLRIRLRRGAPPPVPAPLTPAMPVPVSAPVVPAPAEGAPTTAAVAPLAPSPPVSEEGGLHIVKSPIVGTFYEAPSPGSPPFVKVGDSVEAGGILCIIEAMKLMNEIESDIAGEVAKKLVANGQPVEYGQPLFAIRPR
jgi:acetyl-CoA carboxylase biotin carboxyl carrier protein